MRVKRQRIREQFKSLDFFYANNQRASVTLPKGYKHTMDDIEMAEIFEKEWGDKEISEPKERLDDA